MNQKYTFFRGGTLEFDDQKSVKELITHAFDTFKCDKPIGIDCVTLFQAHHPDTFTGWFTTNVTSSCANEIKNPNELYFAYHLPNIFYYVEGGWGHHMKELGNRPQIDNEVSLKIRYKDLKNTVIVNGQYTFFDLINFLKSTKYITEDCRGIEVIPIGCAEKSYTLSFEDPITKVCLSEFENILEQRICLGEGEFIYHIELGII